MNENENALKRAEHNNRKEHIARSLRDLALYLSGVKDGKGNLLPLGLNVLDNLWEAITILQSHEQHR